MSSKPTAKTSCHCGAVKLTLPNHPDEILDCQCTICYRYGAAWAYYDPREVTIDGAQTTRSYVWGDGWSGFHFCSSCGCVTHWKSLDEERRTMGVNTRMMERDEVRFVNRRVSFGALRAPLKDKELAHPEDRAQY